MDHFIRKDGELFCEGVRLADVAARFGTPTYVYSRATLTRHVDVLRQGFAELPHHICYAVKANGNLALLEVLAELGCDFDAVSAGELLRVLTLGVPAARCLMSGVGKRDDEIALALAAGVRYISVESEAELDAVARLAQAKGARAPVSLRVNPDVDARTHPYIATGLKENKFGIPFGEAEALYLRGARTPSLEMVGITCHIGSQITDIEPFGDAARRMRALGERLIAAGAPLRYLGMGGGLGIPYAGERPPPPERYGQLLAEILKPLGTEIVLEPGRVIVGNAGVLLSQVVRKKRGPERDFVIIDAGMNDLLRPALYKAHHAMELVAAPRGREAAVDVVGPVCESSDVFGKAQPLPPVEAGDLMVLRGAGAYGFAMSSTYNARRRPAEVLCDGDRAILVRAREGYEDLWRGERRLDGQAAPAVLAPALRSLVEDGHG